jgi:biopolymer transport protein ExbB
MMIQAVWQHGGLMATAIVVVGLYALVIFLKQFFHLHRAQIKTSDFLEGIFLILRKGNTVEAISQCEDTPGPVAQMVRAAILAYQRDPGRTRQAMEESALIEIPRLERNVSLLLTLSHAAPVLGLLGTVVGMIELLQAVVLQAPVVMASDLAQGLMRALWSTAAGLAVAVPAYIGHNILVSRVEAIVLDMERAFYELLLSINQVSIREENGTP